MGFLIQSIVNIAWVSNSKVRIYFLSRPTPNQSCISDKNVTVINFEKLAYTTGNLFNSDVMRGKNLLSIADLLITTYQRGGAKSLSVECNLSYSLSTPSGQMCYIVQCGSEFRHRIVIARFESRRAAIIMM